MADPSTAIVVPELLESDPIPPKIVHGYRSTLQSDKSRSTIDESLRRILRVLDAQCAVDQFPWQKLTFENYQLIRKLLARDHAPHTANLSLSALRQMLKIAFVRGFITREQRAALDLLKNVKGTRVINGREIEGFELDRLWTHLLALPGDLGLMCRAMFAVLLGAGARREEACMLRINSYKGAELHIIGKGNKERAVPVDRWMRPHMESWLELRKPMDLNHKLCFFTARPSRNGTGQPLRPWTLWKEVERWAEFAGVTDEDGRSTIHPHDFRSTFACRLLDAGFELTEVQRLLGHESVSTTQRYDKRAAKKLADKRMETPIFEFAA